MNSCFQIFCSQMHEEEEAKSDLIGGYSEDDWDLEALWCEGSVEEMQGMVNNCNNTEPNCLTLVLRPSSPSITD